MNRAVVRPLNAVETSRLNECEEAIAAGLTTYVEVGMALLAISDEKLYRRDYVTFEDYCAGRWEISRNYAYRLMRAARAMLPIGNTDLPLPGNEGQARVLAGVPEEDRVDVWRTALGASDGRPTAAAIRAAAEDHRADTPGDEDGSAPSDAGAGNLQPAPAQDPGLAGPADSSPPAASSLESGPLTVAGGGEEPSPEPAADDGSSHDFVLPDPDDLPEDLDPAAVERYREKLAASQRADYLAAFAKAMSKAGKFLAFDAEQIAADPAHVESVRELLDSTQRFYDRMVKSRTGLRLVSGGRS